MNKNHNNQLKYNNFLPRIVMIVAFGWVFTLAMSSNAVAQEGLRIAAVVNDEAISILDLESRIVMAIASSNVKDGRETRRRMAPSILNGLIEERLMQQEIRRLNIKVNTNEVTAGIAKIEKQNGMNPGDLSKFIKSSGIPISTLATRTEIEIGWNKLIRRVLLPNIRVSDEEVNEIIKSLKINEGKPQFLLGEIFIPMTNSSEEENVKQVANQLFEQLKDGAPFPRMARNFSRSPSAATGGDLGWVSSEQMIPEISSVVLAMKPGQVSMPIRALGGYYIVTLRNARKNPGLGGGNTTLKLSQFHIPLDNNASDIEKNEKRSKLMEMSRGATSCAAFEQAASRAGSPLSGSLGNVKLSALPEGMKAELSSIPAGGISNPLETGGGLAVVMVCEREDGNADMEKIKQRIITNIRMNRLNSSARGYLRDLKREAFVDVRL